MRTRHALRMEDERESHAMGTAESRRARKAQKERRRHRKRIAREHRQKDGIRDALETVINEVKGWVTSGKARVALTTIPASSLLITAMWQRDGVKVGAYDLKNDSAMQDVRSEAREHGITNEQWSELIARHEKAVAAVAEGQTAISGIEWRPGEGPTI